mgnify:CR=1 FL=1
MAIAVVSLKTPEIDSYAVYTTETNRLYCQKHNLQYFCYGHTLDNTKTPHWSKLLALKNHIMDYDWLMWIDADAAFANHTTTIESIIENHSAMILMSKGRLYGWNSGVFLLRGGQESESWLDFVFGLHGTISGPFYEQDAVVHSFGLPLYKDKVIEVPKRLINVSIKDYTAGDFIVHAHGTDNKKRESFFKSLRQSLPS